MIIDIPTEQDFLDVGENLLNLAWDNLLKLLEDFSTVESLVENNIELEKYWHYARPTLLSSFALVQQAVEFYLKAKIIKISPYLLISIDARSLPKKSDIDDVSFSEFRTIDAQDLIKIINTFSTNKLDDKFKSWFRDMRLKRNAIMHTVDSKLTINYDELALSILNAHMYLVGKKKWMISRKKYLEKTPLQSIDFNNTDMDTITQNESYIYLELHKEIALVIKRLNPSEVKNIFGYRKREQSLECKYCYDKFVQNDFFDTKWVDDFIPTLQISTSSFKEWECFVCNNKIECTEFKCLECETVSIDNKTYKCIRCTPLKYRCRTLDYLFTFSISKKISPIRIPKR